MFSNMLAHSSRAPALITFFFYVYEHVLVHFKISLPGIQIIAFTHSLCNMIEIGQIYF